VNQREVSLRAAALAAEAKERDRESYLAGDVELRLPA
jgi:hypothetical protein